MRKERHKPFIVSLELSSTTLTEAEAQAREARLRELSQQATLTRLSKQSGCSGLTTSEGEQDDNA